VINKQKKNNERKMQHNVRKQADFVKTLKKKKIILLKAKIMMFS
jgi:hypothetical protein